MPETIRDEVEAQAPRVAPALVHVCHYEALLEPPLGPVLIGDGLVVGRREGQADRGLWLEDKRVSSRHLELSRQGGLVLASDLGSSNGTCLNGRPLQGPERLKDGDLLEVGRSLLCFREYPHAEVPREGWAFGSARTFHFELGQLAAQLERIAASDEPVLLLGETGVGKELAARLVHERSGRKGPLVAVDCGALPDTLLESTLFGHERGAFTGATEARVGDVVRAHRGTLFLDEVGNLPLGSQAKLLRVLETKSVRTVGGREPVDVEVRWVAATNAALDEESRFRSDLRFRLAGFVARLPPLRKRREDLGLLMAAVLAEAGVTRASLTRAAASRLVFHPLPGNVRQLRQVLRSAAFLSAKDGALTIDADALAELDDFTPAPQEGAALDSPQRMAAPDRGTIESALRTAGGRVAVAARALDTSPRQLYRWLERFEVDPDAFRRPPGAPR